MKMSTGYNDWHREAAKDEFIACCCADVTEPPKLIKRQTWKCSCGWSGIPKQTQNSGGATNHRYCPVCRNSVFLTRKDDD